MLTTALIWATERAYGGGHEVLGDLASVASILLYLVWFTRWRCSRNVGRALWTYLAQPLHRGLIASAVLSTSGAACLIEAAELHPGLDAVPANQPRVISRA